MDNTPHLENIPYVIAPLFAKHPQFNPIFGKSTKKDIHCLYTPAPGCEYVVSIKPDMISIICTASGRMIKIIDEDVPALKEIRALQVDLYGTFDEPLIMTDIGYRQFVRDNIDYGVTMETLQ